MRKIGILGGAFDPPHKGHLVIAETALKQLKLDEIRFIPTNIPPHKRASYASAADRLEMLKLAIEDTNHREFIVDPIELNRTGTSYTIDTIKELHLIEPDSRFYFIIGADMIDYLPNWYKINELIQYISFVGIPRPSYNGVTTFLVQMLEMAEMDISSSDIRRKIQVGIEVDDLVPFKVLNFIKEKGLYGV